MYRIKAESRFEISNFKSLILSILSILVNFYVVTTPARYRRRF